MWSPYRNETKCHPRLVFLPISRSSLIIFLINILNQGQILRHVVSRRNIWPLKYVPTRRNEWNFYALSTTKRRRTIETKNKLWKAPLGWAFRWCFCFIKHTVWPGPIGDRYGYLGAEKIMQLLAARTIRLPEFLRIFLEPCVTIRCGLDGAKRKLYALRHRSTPPSSAHPWSLELLNFPEN